MKLGDEKVRKIWLIAFIAVIVFSLLYYFSLYFATSTVTQSFEKTDIVQKFFMYSLIAFIPIFVFVPRIVRKKVADKSDFYKYLMYFCFLAALAGFLGLFTIRLRSPLNHAGGLLLDFGHTLCSQTIDGALWLLFCFTSWIPYLQGYIWKGIHSRFEKVGLGFVGGLAVYYTLWGFCILFRIITAP